VIRWEASHEPIEWYDPICPNSFDHIAKSLGVTRGRVHQIEVAALKKVQKRIWLDLKIKLELEDVLTWIYLIWLRGGGK
jgi:hypothetical protein